MKAATSNTRSSVATLWRMAKRLGIKPSYTNVLAQPVRASPDALLHTMKCMGMEIETADDAVAAVGRLKHSQDERVLEPVIVLWKGSPQIIRLQLAQSLENLPLDCELVQEDGMRHTWNCQSEPTHTRSPSRRKISLPANLSTGYHRLQIEVAGKRHAAHLFVAPPRAYAGEDDKQPTWGTFLPLYAAHSDRSWGIGDLADLQSLSQWTHSRGGAIVGTLPLLASAMTDVNSVSPYMPLSRQFFNELYLDIDSIYELKTCPEAQQLLASADLQAERRALQQLPLVDYQRVMSLKRRVLELLAANFFEGSHGRLNTMMTEFGAEHQVQSYAAFRAAGERHGPDWRQWPTKLRQGRIDPIDHDRQAWRYHIYVQWILREQLTSLTRDASAKLYLDLPVGVSPAGYDVWRQREQFVQGASMGAPPDEFFSNGQEWGLLPMHPQQSRLNGHTYFRDSVRASLQYARTLRIDHIMALHRLYWVPNGMSPREGVYVRYPADELYAILCIESHRAKARIVGENLGTVPPAVNRMMARRRIAPLYVAQFSWTGNRQTPIEPPPRGAVASLNTHDVPPFAAFWSGDDIAERVKMGLLTSGEADDARKERALFRQSLSSSGRSLEDTEEIRAAMLRLLSLLAQSEAALVLVNLEDLWLERHSQNVPGVTNQTNWRRKSRYSLEELFAFPDVAQVLQVMTSSSRSAHV